MNPKVQQEIKILLQKMLDALQKRDSVVLKGLSDKAIAKISVYQDENLLSVAVALYAMSKILERSGKPISQAMIKNIRHAMLCIPDPVKFEACMRKLLDYLQRVDDKLKMYMQDVIEQANIKKGSHIYASGISTGRVAEMLGISQWELMKYLGQVRFADEGKAKEKISKKLQIARDLFR